MKTVDPLVPPAPTDARFEETAGAWVLSRYADVAEGFTKTRRLVQGVSDPEAWPASREREAARMPEDELQQRMTREARAELSPDRIRAWHGAMLETASAAVSKIRGRVDLVGELLAPWCAVAAGIVTGAPAHDAEETALAEQVSAAAAEPADPEFAAGAAEAARALGRRLRRHGAGGSLSLSHRRSQARVFVALCCTLRSILANGWLALLRQPTELARLRDGRGLLTTAAEEILRCSSVPARLYRQAIAAPRALRYRPGDRVILELAAANRDPARFATPERFDAGRLPRGHLTLGLGPHACAGGPLIRAAIQAATSALASRRVVLDEAQTFTWRGGSGFRSPAALFVSVSD